MKSVFYLTGLLLLAALAFFVSPAMAEGNSASTSTMQTDPEQQVIQSFTSKKHVDSDEIKIPDEKKKLIMFFLGVPLLLLIIATVTLGVAMGVYGKQVYIAHMICAGLSLTLALAHAVVGLVWFYPF